MFNLSLYTYQEDQFHLYRQSRQKLQIPILSLPLVEITQSKINEMLKYEEFDIDLTSAVATMHSESVYQVERLMYQLILSDKKIIFIISEPLSDKALKNLNIIFSNTSSLKIANGKKYKQNVSTSAKLVTNMRKDKLSLLHGHLEDNIIGHKYFKESLVKNIKSFRFFNKVMKDQPILSVFLLGNSGIGKTEAARALHSFLDKKSPLAKINFANYNNESSLASLIGSPPGYKDSETESDLMLKIKRSNSGVLLVDEFEKADSSAHNFFLQLLEEGNFDDAMGTIHNLNGYVIIFTSNMSIEEFNNLPPELRSRFDMVINFENLTLSEKKLFANKLIHDYMKKSKKHLETKQIHEILLQINFESEMNLRNIKKKIRHLFFLFTEE